MKKTNRKQPTTVGPLDSKVMRDKAKKATRKTITSLVLQLFKKDPKISSKEMIEKVKRDFPKSHFQLTHYSWFRHQIIRKGKYNLPSSVVSAMKG